MQTHLARASRKARAWYRLATTSFTSSTATSHKLTIIQVTLRVSISSQNTIKSTNMASKQPAVKAPQGSKQNSSGNHSLAKLAAKNTPNNKSSNHALTLDSEPEFLDRTAPITSQIGPSPNIQLMPKPAPPAKRDVAKPLSAMSPMQRAKAKRYRLEAKMKDYKERAPEIVERAEEYAASKLSPKSLTSTSLQHPTTTIKA